MPQYVLTEAGSATVSLSVEQVAALRQLGSSLASKKAWWGSESSTNDVSIPASVIRLARTDDDKWRVQVPDCIGVVAVDDIQLIVQPKVESSHALYLLGLAGVLPRLDDQTAALAWGESLFDLVARWFVTETERVLRTGLFRDYDEVSKTTPTLRGQLQPTATARLYYRGRLEFAAVFDEFEYDTPLNRVLRAAAELVARHSALEPTVRKRAIRIAARLDDVGPLEQSDLRVTTDSRTAHCAQSLVLALQLLRGRVRTLGPGACSAWAFLIRTPEAVEAGVRQLLRERLTTPVVKSGRQLANGMTLTPDLVFGAGAAVGDVKYKRSDGQWNRPDLYEVVAFAAAFYTRRAALIRFRSGAVKQLGDIHIGDVSVRELTWDTGRSLDRNPSSVLRHVVTRCSVQPPVPWAC